MKHLFLLITLFFLIGGVSAPQEKKQKEQQTIPLKTNTVKQNTNDDIDIYMDSIKKSMVEVEKAKIVVEQNEAYIRNQNKTIEQLQKNKKPEYIFVAYDSIVLDSVKIKRSFIGRMFNSEQKYKIKTDTIKIEKWIKKK